jgi:hypothetical protein
MAVGPLPQSRAGIDVVPQGVHHPEAVSRVRAEARHELLDDQDAREGQDVDPADDPARGPGDHEPSRQTGPGREERDEDEQDQWLPSSGAAFDVVPVDPVHLSVHRSAPPVADRPVWIMPAD